MILDLVLDQAWGRRSKKGYNKEMPRTFGRCFSARCTNVLSSQIARRTEGGNGIPDAETSLWVLPTVPDCNGVFGRRLQSNLDLTSTMCAETPRVEIATSGTISKTPKSVFLREAEICKGEAN